MQYTSSENFSIPEKVSKVLKDKWQEREAKKDYPQIWDNKLDSLFNKVKDYLASYEQENYLTVKRADEFWGHYVEEDNLIYNIPELAHQTLHPKSIVIEFFNGEYILLESIGTEIVDGFGRVDIHMGSDKWFLVAKEKDSDYWLLVNPYHRKEEFELDRDIFLEKIILDFVNGF